MDPLPMHPVGHRLTVVHGSWRTDVVVDPQLSVSALLAQTVPGVVLLATTLTGRLLEEEDTVSGAGLLDGAVLVTTSASATRSGADDVLIETPTGDRARADAVRAPTPVSLGVLLFGGLAAFVAAVVGLPRLGASLSGTGLIALSLAALVSRTLPLLAFRIPPLLAQALPADDPVPLVVPPPPDPPGVQGASVGDWVRTAARRELVACVVVGFVVLLSVALVVVGAVAEDRALPPWSSVSLLACVVTVAGSARCRGRRARVVLTTAAAAPGIALLVLSGASLALPSALVLCAVILAAALAGGARRRRSSAHPRRPGRGRVGSLLGAVAPLVTLPVALWASGVVAGITEWAAEWAAAWARAGGP
ncbi:MAG: hypothetical protein ABI083_09480 [Lapillicoccus sp.]